MKSASFKYAALNGGWGMCVCLGERGAAVVSIIVFWTRSIKHLDHSQETPAVAWQSHRFHQCLPNGNAIFLVHCDFIYLFIFSLLKTLIRNFAVWIGRNLKVKSI